MLLFLNGQRAKVIFVLPGQSQKHYPSLDFAVENGAVRNLIFATPPPSRILAEGFCAWVLSIVRKDKGMSKEQDSSRKAKESARRSRARGYQTRRTRGGKKQKRR